MILSIKRHPLKFYFSIIIGSLFIMAMGTACIFIYIKDSRNSELKPKAHVMPFFSLVFYVMAIYMAYKYFKNVPRIKLDKESISFNAITYALSDITHVELRGKKSFSFFIGFPMEATAITFKDGTVKYIFDEMYKNSSRLKLFLQQVVMNGQEFAEAEREKINPSVLNTEAFETYIGNQFTSFRGLMLWGMIGFFVFILLTQAQEHLAAGGIVIAVVFSAFFFFLFSFQMNYFKVSHSFFVIRNHNFFWKKIIYRITDIDEIIFETQQKMPNCLRVTTKDFKSKLYPAGTLRDHTWLELKRKLESSGLTVRNECILED